MTECLGTQDDGLSNQLSCCKDHGVQEYLYKLVVSSSSGHTRSIKICFYTTTITRRDLSGYSGITAKPPDAQMVSSPDIHFPVLVIAKYELMLKDTSISMTSEKTNMESLKSRKSKRFIGRGGRNYVYNSGSLLLCSLLYQKRLKVIRYLLYPCTCPYPSQSLGTVSVSEWAEFNAKTDTI